ncbi:hypothetical protein [Amphiplicatus metriothermophilus]|uniref:Uncharacterized protein n=1 Tax=Amphiplicatus metriothermophilus TaxID=1519374 RepID=A0A239PZM1_9PROT|nr:hypothetical protein [Amphiplicatus metriothermophilus]MBB5519832.1 hypothetical protein [Amphiplicatus metriothermophilus]SNT75117.1 hypothetical protein SAMN06297382_2560 [Amphiplicatus metriothermophilus]
MANVFNKPFRRTALAVLIGSTLASGAPAATAAETEIDADTALREINAHLDESYARLSQRTLLIAEARMASLASDRDGQTNEKPADGSRDTAVAALAY